MPGDRRSAKTFTAPIAVLPCNLTKAFAIT